LKNILNEFINHLLVFRIYAAAALLLVIVSIGTIGYHLIEGMTLFEGFYMTFITISTIGFSEVGNLSDDSRVLTIVISLMGIGIIAYIASQTTQLLFESEIFKKRALKKQLGKMKDHYIICGYGRIGHRIARDLDNGKVPLVVVENGKSAIERVEQNNLLYVEGNAQEEDVLLEAGIKKAKGVICTLSSDQENIFVTLMAREIREDVFILVRTNQYKNTKKILRAGANKVMSPYEIGADRMANVILRPHVDQFMERLSSGGKQDHVFDEVMIAPGSHLDGKSLTEAKIRQEYFVVIVAIIPDKSDKIIFNPGSEDIMRGDDPLIVLGDMDRIKYLRSYGCNDERTLNERVQHHNYLENLGFNSVLTPPTQI